MEKLYLNLTQQNHIHGSKKCTTTQNKHKKPKPDLVASYDIGLGNGEGLLWFWRFTNLSLTHLDTYPLTYSPGTHSAVPDTSVRSLMTTPLQSHCSVGR